MKSSIKRLSHEIASGDLTEKGQLGSEDVLRRSTLGTGFTAGRVAGEIVGQLRIPSEGEAWGRPW